MYLLKKETATRLEKYSIIGLSVFLTTLFLVSIALGITNQGTEDPPSSNEIIEYAKSFLPGESMEALGTSLDCSGFTKAVYNHYKIHLPASSTRQYSKTMRFEKEASEPGDLLFFNTSGTGISHVAISLGNNKFIHSPGKGKKVCIDSIEQLYWNKRFISGGKVNFNPLK